MSRVSRGVRWPQLHSLGSLFCSVFFVLSKIKAKQNCDLVGWASAQSESECEKWECQKEWTKRPKRPTDAQCSDGRTAPAASARQSREPSPGACPPQTTARGVASKPLFARRFRDLVLCFFVLIKQFNKIQKPVNSAIRADANLLQWLVTIVIAPLGHFNSLTCFSVFLKCNSNQEGRWLSAVLSDESLSSGLVRSACVKREKMSDAEILSQIEEKTAQISCAYDTARDELRQLLG